MISTGRPMTMGAPMMGTPMTTSVSAAPYNSFATPISTFAPTVTAAPYTTLPAMTMAAPAYTTLPATTMAAPMNTAARVISSTPTYTTAPTVAASAYTGVVSAAPVTTTAVSSNVQYARVISGGIDGVVAAPVMMGASPVSVMTVEPVPQAAVEPEGEPALTDGAVTLAPYFKLNDPEKFIAIWQEDYGNFQHIEDCVHYAFCFTDDNRAHCREAYTCAEAVLQHLEDVNAPFNAVLNGPAELERLEVHGPYEEIEKLREALTPLGAQFFYVEWGKRVSAPAMQEDTVCHLYPYFQLKETETFKDIWFGAYPDTLANMDAEKSFQYAFSFEPTLNLASCRESYGDADGILLHLQNVDEPLKAVLNGPSDLLRLEVHAPASEIEKLKPALEPLGCEFFTTGWGFRNAC